MNIGILTFHSALNCGAVLQAYALQTHLEKMGHSVQFINYQKKRRKTYRNFIGKGLSVTINKWQDIYLAWKYGRDENYNAILHVGNTRYSTFKELQDNPPKYEVYIAGSDQIWNIGSSNELNRPYWLDFGSSKIKKIAFAASLGQCEVGKDMYPKIQEQLAHFDAISVREENGADFIRSLSKDSVKVHQISDPTTLLSLEEYKKVFGQVNDKDISNKYIATYILAIYTPEQYKVMEYVQSKLDTPMINLRNPDTCLRIKGAKNIVVKPQQWLAYIFHSSFVICSSFHAVMFSLIFHKRFIALTPHVNQRIFSLLKMMNLEEFCMIAYDSSKIDSLLNKTIDWDKVDSILKKLRIESHDFLLETLN